MFKRSINYIIALSLIFPAHLQAQTSPGHPDEPDFFDSFKDRESVEVEMPTASPEELAEDSPSTITRREAAMMRDMALMLQISNLDLKDQMLVRGKAMGRSIDRLKSQIRNFAPEALVFYTAIGATMARKAYTDHLISGRQNPTWMQDLMAQITSPLGVFSFFCFLIASGQANYWLSQPLRPWSKQLASGKAALDALAEKETKKHKNQAKRGRKTMQSGKTAFKHPEASTSWMNKVKQKMPDTLYKTSRRGFRSFAGITNQMGLAAGIFASNIITEIGTLVTQPSFHYCVNYLLPDGLSNQKLKLSSQNGRLICNDAFEESMSTFKSWGPEILSVVTTAFINHAFIQGLVNTFEGAKKAGFYLLRKVRLRAAFPLSRLLHGMAWLIPGPGATSKVAALAGHWSFRLFSLYTFMEMNEIVSHQWFHGWNENIHAKDLSSSIVSFMQSFKENNNKAGLDCKGKTCSYHPVVQHAASTANYFKRWRRFQSTPISMARQSWFSYFSNASDYFELSYKLNKDIFESHSQANALSFTRYFGPALSALSPNRELFPDTEGKVLPEEANTAFQNINNKIATYFKANYPTPVEKVHYTPVNLVSSIANISFINPHIELDRVIAPFHFLFSLFVADPHTPPPLSSTKERLLALYHLFSTRDTHVPLESFYSNWETELKQAKKAVIRDNSFLWKMYCDQTLEDNKKSHRIELFRESNPKEFQKELDKSDDPDATLKEYFADIKKQKDILNTCRNIKAALPGHQKPVGDILEQESFVTSKDAKQIIRYYYQTHPEAWEQDAKHLLRKKVLAAGSALLTKIARTFIKQKQYGHPAFLSPANKKQITNWIQQGYPLDFIHLATILGPDDIFVQLFKELFIADPEQYTYPSFIRPIPRGMFIKDSINHQYKNKKEYMQLKGHPRQLKIFKTPGIVDYVVASALCGPDLSNSPAHKNLIAKIKKITSKKSTLEKEFPGYEIDDIVAEVPLFSKSFIGGPIIFHPPRTIGLSKHRSHIDALCRGQGHNALTHEDIYNSSFTVNGKNYHNLLNVALEYSHLDNRFPSPADYTQWWEQEVKPYQDLFVLLANREYRQMSKTWVNPLLFQNKKEAGSTFQLMYMEHTSLPAKEFTSDHSSGSQLEEFFPLSLKQGLFTPQKVRRRGGTKTVVRYKEQDKDKATPLNTDNLTLHNEGYQMVFDRGVFQNIHQEMTYWADIIFSLTKDLPEEEAHAYLIKFLDIFDLPAENWLTAYPNGMKEKAKAFLLGMPDQMTYFSREQYKKWIDSFMQSGVSMSELKKSITACELDEEAEHFKKLNKLQKAHLYLNIAACRMNVNMEVLTEKQNAINVALKAKGYFSDEKEFLSAQDKAIGFFYEKDITVNQQLLNYTFMTLKNLFLEMAGYVDVMKTLSESEQIQKATKKVQ